MIRAHLLIALALVALPASATVIEGVTVTDTATLGDKQLVRNGSGVRSRAVFKVYVGSLYLPAKATTLKGVLTDGPRRIQLNMLRTLPAETLVTAFTDGLNENNTAAELEATTEGRAAMVKIMTGFGEVKEGNVITVDYVGGVTTITLNGKARGTIAGAPFNTALMKIWLGSKPVQEDLKKAMLGG